MCMCVCAYAERDRERNREREGVYVCVSKIKIISKLMKKLRLSCTVRNYEPKRKQSVSERYWYIHKKDTSHIKLLAN